MQRWRMVIELTFDWNYGDTNFNKVSGIDVPASERNVGRGQELDRAKGELNSLIRGETFRHFHVLELPHKYYEAD